MADPNLPPSHYGTDQQSEHQGHYDVHPEISHEEAQSVAESLRSAMNEKSIGSAPKVEHHPNKFIYKLKDQTTGRVHRFRASSNNLDLLLTTVQCKVKGGSHPTRNVHPSSSSSDGGASHGDPASDSGVMPVNEEDPFVMVTHRLFYVDDEGDDVFLERNEDLEHAVEYAVKMGKDRLTLKYEVGYPGVASSIPTLPPFSVTAPPEDAYASLTPIPSPLIHPSQPAVPPPCCPTDAKRRLSLSSSADLTTSLNPSKSSSADLPDIYNNKYYDLVEKERREERQKTFVWFSLGLGVSYVALRVAIKSGWLK
jgi:hypothetical protein